MGAYIGNIGYLVKYWGSISKTREIITFQDKRITYYEMNKKVNRVANALRETFDVRKGDRIGVLLGNRVEFLEIMLAASKIGALIVPLNIRLTEHEIEYIVGNAGPKVIFSEHGLIDKLSKGTDENCVQHIVNIDTGEYENLANSAGEQEPENQATWDDDFGILYTSGTTGLPKGAVYTQENLKASLHCLIASKGYTQKDRVYMCLPLCFTGAIINWVPIVYAGGSTVLDTHYDAERFLRTVEKEKVTVLLGVPTMYKFIYDHSLFDTIDFSSVRLAMVGGAPCPEPLVNAYWKKGIQLTANYGLTEGSGTNMILEPEHLNRVGALQPAIWNEIRIVNEAGEEVPPGEVGELIIKGPTVFKGYWNNPEATRETIRDGWLYSGDLAKRDEEGFTYIVGRKKEMIISGGLNVYSTEVENVLYSHPAVKEGAVIGVPHDIWGEAVVAVVVRKPGESIDETEMIRFFREKLADYKCPKAVVFTEQLPLSTSGKVQKNQLKDQFRNLFAGGLNSSTEKIAE